MKYGLVCFVAVVVMAAGTLTSQLYDQRYNDVISGNQKITEETAIKMYEDFLTTYKGLESPNVFDHIQRLPIFIENLQIVSQHNQDSSKSWKMGINKFSDMTEEEFFDHYNLHKNEEQDWSATASPKIKYEGDIPDSIDWRKISMPHGAKVVTKVKDQGKCGSCWAFSTVGAMESHYTLSSSFYALFSEQQLVDCAGDYNTHGCSGGLPSYAFNYIRDNGLAFGKSYPYTAVEGECRFNEHLKAVTSTGPFNITAHDEDQLTETIYNKGPVSVAFQVVGDFKSYKSGVYTSDECKNGPQDVNHAVLAVGYGIDETTGLKYYIIKNSWSETWGDEGFFLIERDNNMCGIAVCNSYPEGVRDIWSSSVAQLLKN